MNERQRLIAIRLALSDCSVGVISRGLLRDMEDVRRTLGKAVDDGLLHTVPPDEWSVASLPPRSRDFPLVSIADLAEKVEALFALSPRESRLVAGLVVCGTLDRELIAAVCPGMSSRSLKVHMSRIRPAIDQWAKASIETLHGVGYRMSGGARERVRGALRHAEAA